MVWNTFAGMVRIGMPTVRQIFLSDISTCPHTFTLAEYTHTLNSRVKSSQKSERLRLVASPLNLKEVLKVNEKIIITCSYLPRLKLLFRIFLLLPDLIWHSSTAAGPAPYCFTGAHQTREFSRTHTTLQKVGICPWVVFSSFLVFLHKSTAF